MEAISVLEHSQLTAACRQLSFKDFLLKNRRNKRLLILAGIAVVVQFAIFKYLYPFASFIHGDSFSYLYAAYDNADINTYMVGYSRFLRLFSVFTRSDTALVAFQYLFIQSSALFLLFTMFYFYHPHRVTQVLLWTFMVFNPLFLHLGNLVSSDCLFVGLSLTWFCLLLWIIHRPSKGVLVAHTIVLFIAFTVRYNALIYPFIALAAFSLARMPWRKKIICLSITFLFCGMFVGYTTYKYFKLTGYVQYSPFSGWQWANNAMYAYRYVDKSDRKPVPEKFQALDNMIREYFDTTRDVNQFPTEKVQAGTFYMWSPGMPLMKYRDSLYKKDTTTIELKKWASMGPLYKDYGLYIIQKYPWQFLQYFIWPNAKKYYAPPVEFLKSFNSGKRYITPIANTWFGYESSAVRTRMKNDKVWVLEFYPILSGVLNVTMLFLLICYISMRGWQQNRVMARGILMGGIVWVINAGFTIGASSAALRFQSFPLLLATIFVFFLVDWLARLAWAGNATNTLKEGDDVHDLQFGTL